MSGDYERKLARILDQKGYAVMRAPTSGGVTKRDLPDLFFSKDQNPICVELKTTSQNVAYYDSEEVDALQRFGRKFGASSWLAARFKQDTNFYCWQPKQARRTETNRYALDRGIEPTLVIEP